MWIVTPLIFTRKKKTTKTKVREKVRVGGAERVSYLSCAAASLASSEGGNCTKRSPARLMSVSYGRSWGICDSRWWTMAMSHSQSSTSSSRCNTICRGRQRCSLGQCRIRSSGTFVVLHGTHYCGEVDGHQGVAGQEEVIQPDDVAEV